MNAPRIVWCLCFGPSVTSSSLSLPSCLHSRSGSLPVKLLACVSVFPLANIASFCSVGHQQFTEIYRCFDVLLELRACMDFVCGTVYQKNTAFRETLFSSHVKSCIGLYSRGENQKLLITATGPLTDFCSGPKL